MKSKSKKHITGSRAARQNSVRPIILSVASALSLVSAQAAYASFAATPLSLQNKTETSGQLAVKHNIMFFIDDSGSMAFNIDGTKTTRVPLAEQRLTIAQNALNSVLDKYQDQFNWGLQTLHNNGGSDTADFSTSWSEMKNKVNQISALSGTPTTRRYYEIVSNVVMPNVEYRCQKSYVVLMSDGDANLSCNYNSKYINSLRTRRLANFAYNQGSYYSDYYNRTINLESDANFSDSYRYFGVPATSGVCVDASGGSYNSFWDREGGLSFFSQHLANADFKTTGVDKAGVSWNGDPNVDPKGADFSKQFVQTFTVGFGGGMTTVGEKYLTQGASRPEWYFNAQSSDSLLNAFTTIAESIQNDSANAGLVATGTVAPATTSSGISDMAANVELDSGTWSSRLRFYDVDAVTGRVNSGAVKYPLFTQRQTLINTDGKNVYWANSYDSYGDNAMFGLGSSAKEDEWKSALVPWVTRKTDDNNIANTYGLAQGYSQDYRVRTASPEESETKNLGDIIDSPVLTIGGGTSDGLVNGRNEFLVTAANDGMVHLFRSHDDQNPYSLALSYIPAAMERGGIEHDTYGGRNIAYTLKEVAHKNYGDASRPHRYLINGGIVVRRTANDTNVKGQQSFMFGAMGQGARGAYALNIGGKNRVTGEDIGLNAGSSSWLSQVPLFETAKTNTASGSARYINMLGYTVGTPQIGRIALQRENGTVDFTKNTRYGGFLASGYGLERSSSPETALYVYDMLGQSAYDGTVNGAAAGEVIHKFMIDGYAGLSSPTLVDTDFDGVVDVAYAGDYAGNMYRFDMRADSTSGWKVTKIFSGNSSQPITSAPAISRRAANKYVVIFGTGSDIYQDDVNDKTQQAVYGIYDDLSEETPAEISVSDLQQQNLSETSDGYRQITSTNAIGEGKKGWFVPLGVNDGERVVVKPTMILRTAVISTRIYNQKTIKTENNSADVCRVDSETTETSSSSWILALNAETGGALQKSDARLKFIQQADSTSAYYTGMKYDGITSFTYMDATKLNDSPVTRDGDSGGSGTDQPFKVANTDIPNNKCFSREAVRVLLTNNNDSFDIEGRICGIRRLSWREIFF